MSARRRSRFRILALGLAAAALVATLTGCGALEAVPIPSAWDAARWDAATWQ